MFVPRKFYIAGVQFRSEEDKATLRTLVEGEELDLLPEPENKFDSNAVRITDGLGTYHFGYVPKKFSSEIAAALEADIPLTCKVTRINPNSKPWEICEVEIKEIEEGA